VLDLLQLEFFRNALISGLLVGGVVSFLGVLVVLKRVVFLGAALAEVASAGLALGFYLGFSARSQGAIFIAFAVTVAVSLLMAYPHRQRVLPQESLVAIGFVVGAAAALLLVSKSAEGVEELKHLLAGHLLTSRPREMWVDLVVFAILMASYLLFHRQMLYVSFDPESAQSAGLRTRSWNMLFYLILGLAIAQAIRSAGTLLVVGYLVLPAAGALLATRRLRSAHLLSVVLAAVGTLAGLLASFSWDVSASAAIVLALFLLTGLCLVFSGRPRG
jgi:zinc transport system permease protein